MYPSRFRQGEWVPFFKVNECLWVSMFLVKLIAHVGKLSENVHCLAHIPAQYLQIELGATGKITLHVKQVPIENKVFTA